jgi:excinuclease ABC subunit C
VEEITAVPGIGVATARAVQEALGVATQNGTEPEATQNGTEPEAAQNGTEPAATQPPPEPDSAAPAPVFQDDRHQASAGSEMSESEQQADRV